MEKEQENKKPVLIVKPDRIGDFVLFAPFLKCYQKMAEGAELHIVVSEEVVPLAETCPFVTKVFSVNIDKGRIAPEGVGQYYYREVYYPVFSRVAKRDQVLTSIKADHKVASAGDDSNESFETQKSRDHLFSTLIPLNYEIVSEKERHKDFLRAIGYQGDFQDQAAIWFDEKDNKFAGDILKSVALEQKEYFVIGPGASFGLKLWPVEKWVLLIDRINEEFNQKIVLCGGRRDRRLAANILRHSSRCHAIVDLTDRLPLRVTAKMIEYASSYIGVDSGLVHIANALKTPNVCIMGGWHFGRFYPYGDHDCNRVVYQKKECYGCNWRCRFIPNSFTNKIKRRLSRWLFFDSLTAPCINEISVDQVMSEVRMLKKLRING